MQYNYQWYTREFKPKEFTKWKFLPVNKIKAEMDKHPNSAHYATVQLYTEDGLHSTCPIFLDLDGKTAEEDFYIIRNICKKSFNIEPHIYFSGHKGYHVFIYAFADSEKVIKEFVLRYFNVPSLDKRVYTKKRMLRLPNSLNLKSGKRKESLTDTELLVSNDYSGVELELKLIAINLPSSKVLKGEQKKAKANWRNSITPCIHAALTHDPGLGNWHNTIFTLSRFFEVYGATEDEAIECFLSQDHYAQDEKYVRKTVRNVYKGRGKKTMGCKDTILEDYCIPMLCKFWRKK